MQDNGSKAIEPADAPRAHVVLTLCTGNAARSVMSGVMLASPSIAVVTAGTHVVEGQPVSRRTRGALASLGLEANGHRSHQLTAADVEAADLVLAMAGEHVAYVRRRHPAAAARTVTIRRLVRHLAPGPPSLSDRLVALRLADLPVEPWEDVLDPAGGDDDAYLACATELAELCAELQPLLS